MGTLIKAAGAAVISAVIGTALKKNSPAMSLLLAIAAAGAVLTMTAGAAVSALSFFIKLANASGMSGLELGTLGKTVVIALISKFASGVCQDAGQSAAASAAETLGAVTALVAALPLFESVYKMAEELI